MPQREERELWRIDQAVIQVPLMFRRALVMHYSQNVSPFATCRSVGVGPEGYGRIMSDARGMVLAVLRGLLAA